jgi:hypothetical protein
MEQLKPTQPIARAPRTASPSASGGYVTIEVTRVDVMVFISSLDHRHGRILSRRRGERPGDHAQESLLLSHVSSVMKIYHFRNYLA